MPEAFSFMPEGGNGLKLHPAVTPRVARRLMQAMGLDETVALKVATLVVPTLSLGDISEVMAWPIFPTFSAIINSPIGAAGERNHVRMRNPTTSEMMIRIQLWAASQNIIAGELVKTDLDLATTFPNTVAGLTLRTQPMDGRLWNAQSVVRWSFLSDSAVQIGDGTFGTMYGPNIVRNPISADWNYAVVIPPGFAFDLLPSTAAAACVYGVTWSETRRDGTWSEDTV